MGDGRVIRDYIYADDVIDAAERVLHYNGQYNVFNIGSGKGESINDIIHIVDQLTSSNLIVKRYPGRKVDVPVNVLDISRAQKELGWNPTISLEQGITKMLTYWDSDKKILKEGNVVSNQPLLSLCIPTNGVLDWVKPVLESIYCQHVDESNFEVIVTDNGNSIEFQQYMGKQVILHDNLHYRKTTSQGFLNQIECFRDANGIFIKFVNHRMMLKMGVIAKLLDFVRTNQKEKLLLFF